MWADYKEAYAVISLADILTASAAQHPEKSAVYYRGTRFTYGELKDRVDRLASALEQRGVRQYDQVALISPNSNVCLELLFATAQLGAVLVQYNVRLSKAVIGELLGKSDAQIVFVSGKVFETADELIRVAGRPLTVFFVDNSASGSGLGYEDLVAKAEPLASAPKVQGSDAAMMLYTSGTTGTPRGVLLSHDAILHQVKTDIKISQQTSESVELCVLPLFHITFLSALETLYSGAELVIIDVCKGSDMALAIKEHGVTHVSLVPFLLKALTTYVEESNIELTTLEQVLYGAEPISLGLLERAQRALNCDFVQGYGMTETTAAITMLLPADHKKREHLHTAGRPLPGVELKVVNDDGTECPAMGIGEVLVKTPALMLGYYHDIERTNQVVKDGWYHTGDIGFLDAQGYLNLVARKDDMIISGGENIYPQEVSACIREMQGVADGAAAGVPDEHWGEALVAVVVKKEGSSLTEQEIIEHCGEVLGHFKKPSKVFFVDKIERSASGKISRRDFKKQLEALMSKATGA